MADVVYGASTAQATGTDDQILASVFAADATDIHFEKRTFTLTDTLVVPAGKRVFGHGAVLSPSGNWAGKPVVRFSGNDVWWHDAMVRGENASVEPDAGVEIAQGVTDIIYAGNEIRNCKYGIVPKQDCERITFRHVRLPGHEEAVRMIETGCKNIRFEATYPVFCDIGYRLRGVTSCEATACDHCDLGWLFHGGMHRAQIHAEFSGGTCELVKFDGSDDDPYVIAEATRVSHMGMSGLEAVVSVKDGDFINFGLQLLNHDGKGGKVDTGTQASNLFRCDTGSSFISYDGKFQDTGGTSVISDASIRHTGGGIMKQLSGGTWYTA